MSGGTGDKITGKAKEVGGSLTGDESKKTEGQAQNLGGKAQDAAKSVTDSVGGAAQGAKDAIFGSK